MTANACAGAPSLPLAGVRVLELGQYIAGPGAAMVLWELGAEVIKVEAVATGDAARTMGRFGQAIFHGYNRGKRSVTLNLRDARAREAAFGLAAQSDVVIQNLRPGAVERLGLDANSLRAQNPRLIYLSISGFGQRGPSRHRPGYDTAAQAESGLMSVTGEPDGPPQRVGTPIIDSATAHVCAQAVLAALFRRERTGEGESIEASLLATALHLQLPILTDYLNGGAEPTRTGNASPSSAPAADLIRTRDGHVVIVAPTEEHWQRLCMALDMSHLAQDPSFATNALRVANRPKLLEVLQASLGHLSSDECVALLAQAQIVAGSVRSISQAVASPDALATAMILRTPSDGRHAYSTLGLPCTFKEGCLRAVASAPNLGADTDTVLLAAGYTRAEIRVMQAQPPGELTE